MNKNHCFKESKKKEQIDIHLNGFEYYIKKFNPGWKIKYIEDVSNQHKQNQDLIAAVYAQRNIDKIVNISIEGKQDYYNIFNDIEKENMVVEIIGKITYSLVDFDEYYLNWNKRIDIKNILYDKIHRSIADILEHNTICRRGYGFSEPARNIINLFSYYYMKYKIYFFLDGIFFKKFVRDLFLSKNNRCFLQIVPNVYNSNRKTSKPEWFTLNLLIPISIIKRDKCFIKQFKIKT